MSLGSKRVRWELRGLIGCYQPYLPLARLKNGDRVISARTEIVIDGFPRSANSFATVAFQMAQPEPVAVAHHLHAPAQIVAAVKRHVPCILLVREPEGAVVSCALRDPDLPAGSALRGYVRYHRHVLAAAQSCVVGSFEQVTTDFGTLVDRTNARYGRTFTRFTTEPEAVEECFRVIEGRAQGMPWASRLDDFLSGRVSRVEFDQLRSEAGEGRHEDIPEHRIARPSSVRADMREEIRDAYMSDELADLRAQAETLYAEIIAIANQPSSA